MILIHYIPHGHAHHKGQYNGTGRVMHMHYECSYYAGMHGLMHAVDKSKLNYACIHLQFLHNNYYYLVRTACIS